MYLQKEGIPKHSEKKIMPLVWTVVTFLILSMELNMILIVLTSLHALDIPELYDR